jgi:N-formylglutamate deformylase
MPEERAEIAPVAVDRPDRPVALVFDSPHSGRHHPEDFRPAVGPFLLRGSEDGLVDDLFADAPHHGATLVRALFARAYVDPNRAPDDLDPLLLPDEWSREIAPTVHSRRGVGLVFRLVGDAIPIYDRVLSVEELDRRIEAYWRPYHDALDGALDGLQRTFGTVWHVNCHSMQSVGNALSPDPGSRRPDFVLGDLDGRSCAPEFTDFVASALRDLGYSVGINDPYRGAFIVERHGRPDEGRHSLQIEINRGLYMDQTSLERHEGFDALREDLGRFALGLSRFVAERTKAPAPSPSSAARHHARPAHGPARTG